MNYTAHSTQHVSQITPKQRRTGVKEQTGIAAFMADVKTRATNSVAARRSTRAFILEISDAYAFIRLQDWRRPLLFLRQMAGQPPIKFGTQGFKCMLVDDKNPARHYTAFVFVGYWLPTPLAVVVLWAWEILGFFRYHGHWSQPDLRCGAIGIRHGRLVRHHGPTILTELIKRDLAEAEEIVR
jgi:hypothetical protein